MVWLFSSTSLGRNSWPHDEKEMKKKKKKIFLTIQNAKLWHRLTIWQKDHCQWHAFCGPCENLPKLGQVESLERSLCTCSVEVWLKLAVKLSKVSVCTTHASSYTIPLRCLQWACHIPKPAGAAKTFPVIATSACQTPPPHWALGWKTQTISSETSVVTHSTQTEESPWLEYRGVESRWQGRDVCQQEQKGRKWYAKKGYTDRCKDKRNGCTVHETLINARAFLFRTSHWI